MNTGIAILLAGLLVAAAIVATNRYEITATGYSGLVYRLDRLTGAIVVCNHGRECQPISEAR